MSAVIASKAESVSAQLVRTENVELLVPKATVAEVLSEMKLSHRVDSEAWFLGEFEWNKNRVPVISIDLLNHLTRETENRKRKFIVLNTLSTNEEDKRYYAIEAQGLPKPLIINEQSIQQQEDSDLSEGVAYTVTIGTRILYIPDFEALEKLAFQFC